MNLIPAEQWAAQQFLPNCERTTVDFIRQIQANALRWAVAQRVTVQGYSIIAEQANQLDPQPPTP